MKNTNKGQQIGGLAGSIGGATAGGIAAVASAGSLGPLIKDGAHIGKEIGKQIGATYDKIHNTATILSNPLEHLFDRFIHFLVGILIPIPFCDDLISELISKYKHYILFFGLIVMISISLYINNPNVFSAKIQDSRLPESLLDYCEKNTMNSGLPVNNPLGGIGLDFSIITAHYLDNGYFLIFNRWHKAIDIVPSENYYNNSKAYQLSGNVIIIATHSGIADWWIDPNGALIARITNQTETIRTAYAHLAEIFITNGQSIEAGEPIGIMGNTGNSTGVHLHYSIEYKNKPETWDFIDPEMVIKNNTPR